MTYNLMQATSFSWAYTAEVGSSPNSPVAPNNLTGIPSLSISHPVPYIVLLFLVNEVGLIFRLFPATNLYLPPDSTRDNSVTDTDVP